MTFRKGTLLLLATAAGATLMMSAPAEAGRRTGNWRYSPEAIYDYQRAQERQAWENRRAYWRQRHGYGDDYGYGYRYGPRRGWYDDDY